VLPTLTIANLNVTGNGIFEQAGAALTISGIASFSAGPNSLILTGVNDFNTLSLNTVGLYDVSVNDIDDVQFSATVVETNSTVNGVSTVNWNNVYQRIDGFGASSAWNGSWTTAEADLLFSTKSNISYLSGTYNGAGVDTPRVATRVLVNTGTGFTDATASWMPAASSPEFWQASRLALADLNKDGRPDLVLLHAQGTDAFNTTPPSHASTALRILRNDGPGHGFVDVTATAVPALPGNGDDFRGTSLAVRDVDGDGWPDIVVGTTESLMDADGNPLRSTRLFRGSSSMRFTLESEFLPTPDADTGEAGDLILGDVAGATDPSLILLTTVNPAKSHAGDLLRIFDWKR
jgi:hypothetical protein